MKKIVLAHTDLIVSAVCMGTVNYGSSIPDAASLEALDHFADLGGNFLDTARVYADWVPTAERQSSEKCLGRWLKRSGRRDMVIATKGGHPLIPEGGGPTLAREDLLHQAQDSCRNLGLDILPLYYLHRDDPSLPVEAIMDTLFLLQDRGLVRHIACSNWTLPRIREAQAYAAGNHRPGFVAVSNRWSLARVAPGSYDPTLVMTDEALLAYHEETQLPLLPFSSQAHGYLSKVSAGRPIAPGLARQYALPENDVLARRARELASAHGVSVAQISQAFFYAQPFPVVPLIAFSSFSQMEEAAAATELTLSAQELACLLDA